MIRVFKPAHWAWVSMTGPDAPEFLHRLTTVHVRALQPGHGEAGCFLTPLGKLRAHFHLWRTEDAGFGFELEAGSDGSAKQALLAVIDQYTFGEKFTLGETEGLECRWLWADTPDEEQALLETLSAGELETGQTEAADQGLRLCHHGARQFGRSWITAWGTREALEGWLAQLHKVTAPVDAATIEEWRIGALSPTYPNELNENVIPLEAGLTDAIADQKGCYPGQEVIERIVALGAPARRLALLEGQVEGQGQAPGRGAKIFNLAEPPVEIGEVTSASAARDGRFIALGYIRKLHAKEGFDVRFDSAPDSPSNGKIARVAPYSTREDAAGA